jgi:hypothetical protein
VVADLTSDTFVTAIGCFGAFDVLVPCLSEQVFGGKEGG